MSKYKFIGTEQDLIDNGFIGGYDKVLNENGYTRECDDSSDEIVVFLKTDRFKENIFYYNFGWEEVVKKHIQDLIDKGLVVEDYE